MTKTNIIVVLVIALVINILYSAAIHRQLTITSSHLEFYKYQDSLTNSEIKSGDLGQLVRCVDYHGTKFRCMHTSYGFGDDDKSKTPVLHDKEVWYIDRRGHQYFHDENRCEVCQSEKEDTASSVTSKVHTIPFNVDEGDVKYSISDEARKEVKRANNIVKTIIVDKDTPSNVQVNYLRIKELKR